MVEIDALISQYSHLNKYEQEKEALLALRKIASLVKPLMRARKWRVGTLMEFFPEQQNLLGLNINGGQKICLRLRYAGNKNNFLPMEQVVDTMLHELAHNVHGPHDEKFHALWDQLRKEYEGLISKGYTGEGFLSDGQRLGGASDDNPSALLLRVRKVSKEEARRIARNAAEKRRTLHSGSGQKLGGRPVPAGTDIRSVVVDAIERRKIVMKGCGENNKSDREIIDLTEEATQSGFKTKVDEDDANDRAIVQALWELVQEDQKKEYGKDYVQPTASNPTGNGGGEVGSPTTNAIKREAPSSVDSAKPRAKAPPFRQNPDRPVSRLVAEGSAKKPRALSSRAGTAPALVEHQAFSPVPVPAAVQTPDPSSPVLFATGWTCPFCTLYNPINFLSCDACTAERPTEITTQIANTERWKATTQKPVPQTQTWTCSQCTTVMEHKWWTCSTCGKMKNTS